MLKCLEKRLLQFPLVVENPTVSDALREIGGPSLSALGRLREAVAPALQSLVDRETGTVRAAARTGFQGRDPTNYDAAWVRDAVWAALAEESASVRSKTLNWIASYFRSSSQQERLLGLIRHPELYGLGRSKMLVPHIRFDSSSKDFADVQENGRPQEWNHKQNDALGMFLRAFAGQADVRDPNAVTVIALLSAYLGRIAVFDQEDSGMWEEIERHNVSSKLMALAGLRGALTWIEKRLGGHEWNRFVEEKSVLWDVPALAEAASVRSLHAAVEYGTRVVRRDFLNGESGSYGVGDPRRRTSDAALLSVLYPFSDLEMDVSSLKRVIGFVIPLIRERGIIRYCGDAYQARGFWSETQAATTDHSDLGAFTSRGSSLRWGDEAQWFFDSWLSAGLSRFVRASARDAYERETALRCAWLALQRAVAQITPQYECPESYNVVSEAVFTPSPICPLEWAKASLRLAFSEMGKIYGV